MGLKFTVWLLFTQANRTETLGVRVSAGGREQKKRHRLGNHLFNPQHQFRKFSRLRTLGHGVRPDGDGVRTPDSEYTSPTHFPMPDPITRSLSLLCLSATPKHVTTLYLRPGPQTAGSRLPSSRGEPVRASPSFQFPESAYYTQWLSGTEKRTQATTDSQPGGVAR